MIYCRNAKRRSYADSAMLRNFTWAGRNRMRP